MSVGAFCPPEVSLAGSTHCLSENTDIICRREIQGMRWRCGKTGLWLMCQLPFLVANRLVRPMPCVYPTAGFPTIRHSEVRDILADLLTKVCSDVAVEAQLAPVSGEVFLAVSANTANSAGADIRARGLWTRPQNAFLDVRIFIPMLRPMPPDLSRNCWQSMRGIRSWSMLSVSSMWTVGYLLH